MMFTRPELAQLRGTCRYTTLSFAPFVVSVDRKMITRLSTPLHLLPNAIPFLVPKVQCSTRARQTSNQQGSLLVDISSEALGLISRLMRPGHVAGACARRVSPLSDSSVRHEEIFAGVAGITSRVSYSIDIFSIAPLHACWIEKVM
jgi:hypothetical protein